MTFTLPLLWVAAPGCGEVDVVGEVIPAQPAPAAAGAPAPEDQRGGSGRQAPGPADEGEPAHTGEACAAAPAVFGQALCVCERALLAGNLSTRTLGGQPPRAHVWLDGPLQVAGFSGPIDGDLSVIGAGVSVLLAEGARIAGDLRATTDLGLQNTTAVRGDAWLAGALLGEGVLAVEGDLHVPAQDAPIAFGGARVEHTGTTRVETLSLTPPCACNPAETLAIAPWVGAAAGNNDNATTGFDNAATEGLPPGAILELPPGRLFAEALESAGALTLRVDGKTTLFLSRLAVAGDLRAEFGAAGELAIVVAGDAALGGELQLGAAEQPGAGRLYVAGEMWVGDGGAADAPGLDLVAELFGAPPAELAAGATEARWSANLYAPRLALTFSGHAMVSGSLFVGSLVARGGLELLHDPEAAHASEVCDDL